MWTTVATLRQVQRWLPAKESRLWCPGRCGLGGLGGLLEEDGDGMICLDVFFSRLTDPDTSLNFPDHFEANQISSSATKQTQNAPRCPGRDPSPHRLQQSHPRWSPTTSICRFCSGKPFRGMKAVTPIPPLYNHPRSRFRTA